MNLSNLSRVANLEARKNAIQSALSYYDGVTGEARTLNTTSPCCDERQQATDGGTKVVHEETRAHESVIHFSNLSPMTQGAIRLLAIADLQRQLGQVISEIQSL